MLMLKNIGELVISLNKHYLVVILLTCICKFCKGYVGIVNKYSCNQITHRMFIPSEIAFV